MIGVEPILHILLYLTAAVSLLPVLPYLNWWVLVLLVLATLIGIIGDRQGRYLLRNLPATMLSIGFFLVFLLQVRLTYLVEPLIQLLCLLLTVRLATDKSPRHMLQLFLLAAIILASSSMLTLNMAYLVYLVLLVLMVTSGLVLLSFHVTDTRIRFNRSEWRSLLKTLQLLPAGSLVLMLVLFVVLPRTQTPLWNFLNPQPKAVVGMSDRVSPGSVTELAQSGQLAFRAETEQIPVGELYWRGIVLNRIQGQTWTRSQQVPEERFLPGKSRELQLRIYAEPKADTYLVTLDHPRQVDQVRHRFSSDAVARAYSSAGHKLNYLVTAEWDAHSQLLGGADDYRRLPDNLPPRLVQIGSEIGRQGTNFRDKVDRLEAFFRQQQLSYSSRKLPVTVNPIETFLFDTKRGYCEYFASSFALLLRIAGVPARLVGGYLGGEYNQLGGYYLVGEDLAHVWVEALDDQGIWRRIDPSKLAVNADQELLAGRRHNLSSLRFLADAMLHNWNRLVLSYDLREQFALFRQIGQQAHRLKNLHGLPVTSLFWGLVPLTMCLLTFFLIRHRTRVPHLVKNYRRRLARSCGVAELPADLGLYELARRTGATPCRDFARIYGAALYRGKSLNTAEIRQLKGIVRSIKNLRFPIEVAKPSTDGDNMGSGTENS